MGEEKKKRTPAQIAAFKKMQDALKKKREDLKIIKKRKDLKIIKDINIVYNYIHKLEEALHDKFARDKKERIYIKKNLYLIYFLLIIFSIIIFKKL